MILRFNMDMVIYAAFIARLWRMKVYAIRIFVDQWEAACEFYAQQLGLECEFRHDELGWAEFAAGGARFGVERVDDDSPKDTKALVGRFVGVSLQVDDVEVSYSELVERGVEFVEPPEQQSWGGVLAHCKDPCGNIITLMSSAE